MSVIGVQFDKMTQTLRKAPSGLWTATMGLPNRKTNTDLWVAALKISQEACQGDVSLTQIVNPDTMKVPPTNIVQQALLARKHRTILFVGFIETASRRTTHLEPQGFLMANHDDEGLYIDIICALKPFGSLLMEAFLQRADEKGQNVTLSALPTVLTQQPRFGFQFRTSCDKPVVDVPNELQDRLNRRIQSKDLPENLTAAQADDDWSDLLLFLQDKQLNVNKKGACKKRKVSKNEIQKDNCGVDGYVMKRCV